MQATAADVARPLEPLWRGFLVYRGLVLVCSVVAVATRLPEYALPGAAVAVTAWTVVWTAFTSVLYLRWGVRWRRWVALVDLGVTAAVLGTTPFVLSAAQIAADAPVMGSFWTSSAVLACALAYGVRGGVGGAAVITMLLLLTQPRLETELGDIELLVVSGVTVGYAATVLARSAERVRQAVAAEAAMAERERLARVVHDRVLQVLGYVSRRGAELGGPAGELGLLAGEQEHTLRTLLVSGPAVVDAAGRRDLAAALRQLATARVTVSAPAQPVTLPAPVTDELVAVVTAALANVAVHVGQDAPAWVLLEDLGDVVEISVRDDGPGIPDGRLVAAAAEGRLGVAGSMLGRVRDLGATITCETGPGRGTEWIVRLAKEAE